MVDSQTRYLSWLRAQRNAVYRAFDRSDWVGKVEVQQEIREGERTWGMERQEKDAD